MSRRTKEAAESAAAKASEAARTLQARGQEKVTESTQAVEPQHDDVATPPERVEKLLNARPSVQMLDEIAERRGLNQPTEEVDPVVEEVKEEPKVEAEPAVEPVVEAPKTVKVKVDGEEMEVSQADIDEAGGVAPYRMMKAADNRLKKASEVLAEAQKLRAEPTKQPEKPSQTDQQFIADRMDKIRFGTPEEATSAWMEIEARKKGQQIDPQAISAQVEDRIANKQAVSKFREEFSDIANNPILWDAAVALENRKKVAWQGRSIDYVSEYRKIGNEVRSAFGRQSQPTTKTEAPGTPSQSKEEKKASAANVVSLPSSSVRAELPKEEKPETREEMLNAMRKARGLPTG